MERVNKDARFSHITKDLRFRRMPKHEKKVKIDKRFKDMFTDKRFKLKYSVDKRGKPINVTTNENLKQYYELSDSSDNEQEEEGIEEEMLKSETVNNSLTKKSGPEKKQKKESVKTLSAKEENKKEKSNINKEKKQHGEKQDTDTSDDEELTTQTVNKAGKVSVSNDKATQRRKTEKVSVSNNDKTTQRRKTEKVSVTNDDKAMLRKNISKGKASSKVMTAEEEESDEEEEDDDVEEGEEESDSEDSGLGDGPDLARGEGNVETSSSSEDEDSEEEVEEQEELEHAWGELDKDVPAAEEIGRRLAVCNMDWDRIKAQDIFVLLHSFVSTGGTLQSVKVFPSEFGLQRMREEALSGPTELVQLKQERGAGTEEEEEEQGEEEDYDESQGTRYHREKLRQYQLNRLKYYYAVVETDSKDTASKIYEECDGMEYESSSTKLDLRFIPDDMEFTEEPRSVCTETPAAYNPSLFVSTALAQSKVNLTWDETDQDRVKVTMRNPSLSGKKTDDVNEEDFQAFLASSEEEEEDNDEDKPVIGVDDDYKADDDEDDDSEENQIKKYRSLLQSLDDDKTRKKKKEVEMEVTWEPGLKETTEKIIKHKEKTKDQTPWEQYLMKKKEKRQKKKEERMKKKMTSTELPDEESAAFSDDELPADLRDDPFFKQNLDSDENTEKNMKESKKSKKKKKKHSKPVNREAEGELELLMLDEEADNKKHFSLKSIMKESTKNKKSPQEPKQGQEFQVDVKDSRFSAIYDSYLYNIDPSAPEYKKTKSMEAIIEEKLNRRKSGKTSKSVSAGGQKRKADPDSSAAEHAATSVKPDSEGIASLIKSVKSKTQTFHSAKRKK
uniref:ESF1 homolog isoform X1 n=1 Tax=Crassostrea virginica TaxID=6565 RepID=A0A8B8E5Q4_CRAVI|nr:ESF1 homolog isoform X1 [Crassostrea virginica]XP_022335035.1 ESF1 homolog isoform X1 [Crassostrea virginica]